jgi:type I restriction enzyme S subunit
MRAMKDSGIEWIGEIPKEWEICRLKNYALICNGQDYQTVYDEDGEYSVIGSGGIFSRAFKYMYDEPSVLLGRKGTIDNPLYVDSPFWTVDTMYYTKIDNSNNNAKYFYYLCCLIDFGYYQYGSAVPSMTQRDLSSIAFPKLQLTEQNHIADFLDVKCAKIDKTIEQQRVAIEKLKTYKQSVITEAVTKGLNPDTQMKDSGIKWIGDIHSQ